MSNFELGTKGLQQDKIQEYNNEPVYYCRNCLSLMVRGIGESSEFDYCDDCGSTQILCSSISDWEMIYKNRYGYKFLEK